METLDPSGRLYRRFQYCAYWQYLSTLQSNTSSKDGDSLTHQMGLSRASFFRYFTQLHGTLNARSEKQGCTYVDTILSNFRYNSTATREQCEALEDVGDSIGINYINLKLLRELLIKDSKLMEKAGILLTSSLMDSFKCYPIKYARYCIFRVF